jgi:hypothetical protein
MFHRVPLAVPTTVSSLNTVASSRDTRSRSTRIETPSVSKRSASPGPGPSTVKIRQLKAAYAHRGREMLGSSRSFGIRQGSPAASPSDPAGSSTATSTTGEAAQQTGANETPAGSGSETGVSTALTTSQSTSRAPLFASGTSTTETIATPTAVSSPTSGPFTSPLFPSPTLGTVSGSGTPVVSPSAAPSPSLKVYVPAAGAVLLQGDNGLLVNMTLGGDDVDQA